MTTVFGDTFFYIALLNRQDACHSRALDHTRTHSPRVITTEWVWTEVADAFCATSQRHLVLPAWKTLQADTETTIVSSSSMLFEKGLRLFDSRLDKGWSLTDCISFVVMWEYGITVALTGDRHFEQAGFTVAFPAV